MSSKILIIGGGLSGLALAQICRRNGFDFEVFERDQGDGARAQGWAISLRECLAGMYKMFPEDMPPLEESVSVFKGLDPEGELRRPVAGAAHYETGECIASMRSASKEESIPHHWIRANRARFRAWLQHNLKVNWNKHCTGYEESESGVRARFADGSFADGGLLVAADGASSYVRGQLLGQEHDKFEIAPLQALAANVTLPEAEYAELLERGSAFYTVNSPRYQFFVGVRDFNPTPTKTGEYYWSVTWDDGAAAQDDHATAAAAATTTTTGPPETGEARRQACLDRTADMHPSLRRLIEKTEPGQMTDTALMLRQWAPPAGTTRLPGRRVTLMGDALHTMTPFRGAGANTAILDALEIAQLLVQARAAGRDLADIIAPYEQVAVPRGRATMEFSRSAGLSPDPYYWSNIFKKAYHQGYEWKELDQKL